MFHYAVGYATIIMSVINIMKGFNISELPKEWKTAYVALIIAPGGTEVVLELLKLWRFISRRNQAQKYKSTSETAGRVKTLARRILF